MTDPDTHQKTLIGIFPAPSTGDQDPGLDATGYTDASNVGQCYALAPEDRTLKKFQFIMRSGTKYRIPYALLPIVELTDRADALIIRAYELNICVTGRGLEIIETYLADETLLWIRENPSKKDDGQSPVFISGIDATGKAIGK